MGNSSSSNRHYSKASHFSYKPELDHKCGAEAVQHTYKAGQDNDDTDRRRMVPATDASNRVEESKKSACNTDATQNVPSSPPPYSTATCVPSRRNGHENKHPDEDLLETLRKYDTVIVVDDSGSMQCYWSETCQALAALTKTASKYDANGIDIHFLNDERSGHGMKSPEAVMSLFKTVRPSGCTPIGERLDMLLRDYINDLDRAADPKKVKPINYLVITDGMPTDDPASVIVSAAQLLDKRCRPLSQIGIQFVQIGNDIGAKKFLRQLDDELVPIYHCRDMVDTTPCDSYYGQSFNEDILIKALLGGINRRLDKQSFPTH